jgi:hypothetical protein
LFLGLCPRDMYVRMMETVQTMVLKPHIILQIGDFLFPLGIPKTILRVPPALDGTGRLLEMTVSVTEACLDCELHNKWT